MRPWRRPFFAFHVALYHLTIASSYHIDTMPTQLLETPESAPTMLTKTPECPNCTFLGRDEMMLSVDDNPPQKPV
jgi:hypothetical protein